MLVSTVQWNESAIHIHISPPFGFSSHSDYHSTLSRAPCAIQYVLILLLFSHQVISDCDPMGCSMPGFSVLHYLPEFTQTHVHWVGPCYLIISSSVAPLSFCLQSFPAPESFPKSWLFASGGQSIGDSVSASVLPMNIQGWFPLGLTGLRSNQSVLKEISSPRDSQESFPAPQLETILRPKILTNIQ